jgi:hypothetical protein
VERGERLLPLTAARSKPAVPFGGQYRIVDFVRVGVYDLLSNEIPGCDHMKSVNIGGMWERWRPTGRRIWIYWEINPSSICAILIGRYVPARTVAPWRRSYERA